MAQEQVELKPCPFCGQRLLMRGGRNNYGRCDTEGCWMHERKCTVPIGDPHQVATWNTRATPDVRNGQFEIGDRVTKLRGSAWTGRVVGFYSTSLTSHGVAIESENEPGSVQIYPSTAIRALDVAGATCAKCAQVGAAGEEWREIASAPKDGTRIWLYWPEASADDRQQVGWWEKPGIDPAQWINHADSMEFYRPTHWRPLPAPPALAKMPGAGS